MFILTAVIYFTINICSSIYLTAGINMYTGDYSDLINDVS